MKFIFLGYKSSVKSYKLWRLETEKLVINRDVIFDENSMIRVLVVKDSNVEIMLRYVKQVESETVLVPNLDE